MSKVDEYIDKTLEFEKNVISDNAINDIVNISVKTMLDCKENTSPEHEWLCFNNLLELIRNRVREKLEKMEYFKWVT